MAAVTSTVASRYQKLGNNNNQKLTYKIDNTYKTEESSYDYNRNF